LSKFGALLTGRRVSVSDLDQTLIVEGLRMVSDRLQAECAAAAERGERSQLYETLLTIINGDSESTGLVRRVSDRPPDPRYLEPMWQPINPE
jgi:hypothetical protein